MIYSPVSPESTDIFGNADYDADYDVDCDVVYDVDYDVKHEDTNRLTDMDTNEYESTEFPGLNCLPMLRDKMGDDASAVQAFHMATFWIKCLGYKELPDDLPEALQMDHVYSATFSDVDLRIVLLDVKQNADDSFTTRMVIAKTC